MRGGIVNPGPENGGLRKYLPEKKDKGSWGKGTYRVEARKRNLRRRNNQSSD